MNQQEKGFINLKVPPNAVEIERSILGAIFLDNGCLPVVMGELKPECFYDKKNRIIYEICIDLFQSSEPVDSLSIFEELKKRNQIDEVGGAKYIASIATEISSSANIQYHSKIILEKYVLRELISLGMNLAHDSYDNSKDVFDILNEAEKKIINTSSSIFKNDAHRLKQVYNQLIRHIENIKSSGLNSFSLPTEFFDVDRIMGGLRKGEYIIVAARPSVGKTSFAWCIANNVKVPVGFFSLEMSNISLGARALGIEADIKPFDILSGGISNDEIAEILRVTHRCTKEIYIDDNAGLSPLEIKSKALRMKMEFGIQLIIIDYLQLIKIKNHKDNREREIAEINLSLKNLAKELNIPVVALSQLSRKVEERTNKRPQLSDLRESGSSEQDADVVIFLYRPEIYDIKKFADGDDTSGKAEIIVAKNRNGSIGDCKLQFIKEKTLFRNLSTFPPIENYQEEVF